MASDPEIEHLRSRGEMDPSAEEATLRGILFEQSKDGVVVLDSNGKVREVNQSFADMIGYTLDEARELHVWDWDDRWTREELLERLRAGAFHDLTFETRHRRKDGVILDVEISASTVEWRGQRLLYAIHRDISDRKAAEEALRKSEAMYRSLIDASPDAITVTDLDGRLLAVNHSALEIFGELQIQDVVGRSFLDWVLPGGREDAIRDFKRLLTEGSLKHVEMTLIRRNGDPFLADVNATRVCDATGQPQFLTVITTDISERKRTEQALRETEAKFRMVFDLLPVGVTLIDPETRGFTIFNDAAARSLGYDRDEFARMSVRQIEAIHDEARVRQNFADLLAGKRVTFETQLWTKSRRRRDAWVIAERVEVGERPFVLSMHLDITDRKQAEEALREREEIYSAIVNQATDGIVLIDPVTQRLVEFNDAACQGLGYTREEFAAIRLHQVQANWNAQQISERITAVWKAGGGTFENRQRRKDGTIRDVRVSNRVVRIRGRDYLSGIWTDITERKHAEAAIQQAMSRLQATLESTADGILAANLEGGIIDHNERLLDLWRFPKERTPPHGIRGVETLLEDQPVMQFAMEHVKDPQGFMAKTRQVYAEPEASSFDVLEFRDGRTLERYSQPQRIDGRPVGRVWSFRDVSRRKQAEALLHTRLRLSELAQRSNLEELMQAALDEAETLTGSCIGFFHFVDASQEYVSLQVWSTNTKRRMCQAESNGLHYPISRRQVRVDCIHARAPVMHNDYAGLAHKRGLPEGHAPVVRELTVPVLHNDLVVAIVGVGNKPTDYTQDDVHALAELASQAMDLVAEKQAEEAKRQLEIQLLHAQKLESLGVLAGGIAHDFNNLLAGIRAYAELVRAELPPSTPAVERLEHIQNAVRQATDLTRQILTYAGKGALRSEQLDLSQLVGGMKAILEVSISKKASLAYDLASALPAVQADAGQIRQIVMNFVVNASEALGDGGGEISIRTGELQVDADRPAETGLGHCLPYGQYVCLEVADTGCGIDKPTLERIFDPFFTTKFTGRGLGLATVQGLVRAHRGAVQVASEPGRGSTFRVLLPASGIAAVPVRTYSAVTATARGSGTVLVADDERIVRESTGALFESAGFHVITAGDGQEAIDIYRENRDHIVCVVLDLTMPKKGGVEVFRELHEIDPDVRVILTSGYAQQEIMKRFAGQPLFGFVEKPEPLDGMIAKLQNALADRQ